MHITLGWVKKILDDLEVAYQLLDAAIIKDRGGDSGALQKLYAKVHSITSSMLSSESLLQVTMRLFLNAYCEWRATSCLSLSRFPFINCICRLWKSSYKKSRLQGKSCVKKILTYSQMWQVNILHPTVHTLPLHNACLSACFCLFTSTASVVSSGVLVAGRKKKRRDDDDDEASSLKEVDADYMQRQNEIQAEIATLSSSLLDQKNQLCTLHYALQNAEGPCMEEYRAICDEMKFQRQVWHGGAPNGGDCHKAVQPQAIRRFMEVLIHYFVCVGLL